MRDSVPEIRPGQLAGMPLFWSESDLPFAAALEFRVGRADENLSRGGISHLVEHLALPAERLRGLEFNGQVDGTTTSFWATGQRDAVLAWVEQTAASLARLPLGRLEVERSIMLTESESWNPGHAGGTAGLRFGPCGHGLAGYEQYGLYWLDKAQVEEWAAARFTRGNGALCMTGPPPDSLELPLPDGPRHDPTEPDPIPGIRYPSVFSNGPAGTLAASFVVPRTSTTMVALAVATDRLRQHLRYRAGISYDVESWYEPMTLREAHAVIWADAMEHNVTLVRNGILTVLSDLAERGATEEELTHDLEAFRAVVDDPSSLPGALHATAAWALMGGEFISQHEHLREREETRSEDVASVVAEALETMLLVIPADSAAPAGRFHAYPTSAPGRVTGRRHRRRSRLPWRRTPDETLLVGEEGVSWIGPDLTATVRFDDCEAALVWERQNTRALWSRDGFSVWIDPLEWRGGEDVVAFVDARVPGDRVVPMEGRPPFADPDLTEGAALAEQERHQEAIPLLRAGLERNPDEGLAWCALAAAYLGTSDWSRALPASREATRLAATLPRAHLLHATALRAVGRAAEALDSAKRALELDPADVDTLSGAATLFAESGAEADARRAMTRLLELHPDDPAARVGVGWAAQALGEWDEGMAQLERAVELEPANPLALNNLGWACLNVGRAEEALKRFDAALRLDRAMTYAQRNRLVALALLGRTDEARRGLEQHGRERVAECARAAAEHPEEVEPLLLQSRALFHLNRLDETLRVLHDAADRAPDDGGVFMDLAVALAYAGRSEEATRAADRAAELRPDDVEAHFARAWAYAVAGRPDEATRSAQQARHAAPAHPQAHFAEGLARVAEGRWAEARDLLAQTLAIRPLDCCANRWVAYVARQLGDKTEAERHERLGAAVSPFTTCLGAFGERADAEGERYASTASSTRSGMSKFA